ncbi:MAG: hypothetical protein IKQ11_04840 [Paludibacteraceae bacterium]|nr:hypothetical protein [Paludibacteraceae bacterium]
MKKLFSFIAVMAVSMSLSAQLAWDTEFTKDDFNNAQTVISKSENVSFDNPVLGIGGGLKIGKLVILGSAYEDECVIALSQVGIPETLSFAWQGGSNGSFSVYQSTDHNNWSLVLTKEGNTISTDTEESVTLATNTRYLKFYASAKTAVAFRKIKVTELKSLSASTDEWPFGTAMVDDADGVKSVAVNWTNIVAQVSSTDPHFSASLTTIGQKNQINQTTQLNIIYSHSEAGKHSGEIVIAGEGKEVRIVVSGETKKYDQTLTWIQTLDECATTDKILLNAFTSSGLPVVYESSDSTVAYVEEGVVQIVCAGEVTLTATQPGNYKYNAAEPIAKSLVIRKADPMIGVTVDDLTYGQPLSAAVIHETLGQLTGSFAWQDIAVDTLLDAGNYALTLLFTPDDACVYNTRQLQVAVHVNKAVQTILWEGQETALTVGTPVPSTAILSSGLPITYAYTECLLSIEDGIILPENEGEVTVVAYHPGNHNYLPTTVIMTIFTIEASSGDETDVEQLSAEQQRAARKFMHAGQVYMHYAGRVYDAQGKLIKDF